MSENEEPEKPELPADVPDIETLALAAHEIAHGLMAASLGHDVDSANLCKSWWSGTATHGYMRWYAPDEEDGETWADADTMVCLA
ncbi:MAG TPA: hypothetical protein VK028_04570, partial [Micromonosporaceae bacterium]|nr:hypothetical protein [Micromonosporaceae bacterium]